jgi:hypothetical protein
MSFYLKIDSLISTTFWLILPKNHFIDKIYDQIKQKTIKNRMISLFNSLTLYLFISIYVIISSTKFLVDRAQTLIILETKSVVNFVDIFNNSAW